MAPSQCSRLKRPCSSRRSPSGRECLWTALGARSTKSLAGADDGVDFRDVFLDFVAVALDEASGYDEALCCAGSLVLHHFEDGVDGLLLGGIDEGTGVDDENLGVFGMAGQARTGAVQQPHHDFGVDKIFGAAQRNKAHGWGEFRLRGSGKFAHSFIVPGY